MRDRLLAALLVMALLCAAMAGTVAEISEDERPEGLVLEVVEASLEDLTAEDERQYGEAASGASLSEADDAAFAGAGEIPISDDDGGVAENDAFEGDADPSLADEAESEESRGGETPSEAAPFEPQAQSDSEAGQSDLQVQSDGEAEPSVPQAQSGGEAEPSEPLAQSGGDSKQSDPETQPDDKTETPEPQVQTDGEGEPSEPETPSDVEGEPSNVETQAGGEVESDDAAEAGSERLVGTEAGIDPRDCQHPVTVAVLNREGMDVSFQDLENGTHRVSGSGVLVELCADCGMVIRREDASVEPCSYRTLEGYGTFCRWCGHIKGDDGRHEHHFSGTYYEFPGALIESIPAPSDPELYHIRRFQKTRARKCDLCEAYETLQPVPGETIALREFHTWGADGRCALCGLARSCRHDGETFENEWTEDMAYTFVNASAHEYATIHYVQKCCAKCGEPLGNVEVKRVTALEPHRFADGRCEDCGYVNLCAHANMRYTYDWDDGQASFTTVNALNHRATRGLFVVGTYCPDCGDRQTNIRLEVPAGREVDLPHQFDAEGRCAQCGYVSRVKESECSHPVESRKALDPNDADALKRNCRYVAAAEMSGEAGHVLQVDYDPSWVCELCGHREDLSASARTLAIAEPHSFENGYCVTAGCGYKCAHSVIDGETEVGEPFYEYDGADGHYLVTTAVATGHCSLCGEYVKNHIVEKTRGDRETHSMSDGVCRKCGYACPHPSADIVELLPSVRTVRVPNGEAVHLVREERVTETICKACGYTLFETVEALSEYPETHSLKDGVCTGCGYRPDED